jgi:hypothetical protein
MDSTYASSVAILRRILRLEGALIDAAPAVPVPVVDDGDQLPAGPPS